MGIFTNIFKYLVPLGISYPVISTLIAASMGALLFGGAWFGYIKANTPAAEHQIEFAENLAPLTSETPAPSLPQQKFLLILEKYQRQFASNKLVVCQNASGEPIYILNQLDNTKNIDLTNEMYGANDAVSQSRLKDLIDSLPTEYVKSFPINTYDTIAVLGLTGKGQSYADRLRTTTR